MHLMADVMEKKTRRLGAGLEWRGVSRSLERPGDGSGAGLGAQAHFGPIKGQELGAVPYANLDHSFR